MRVGITCLVPQRREVIREYPPHRGDNHLSDGRTPHDTPLLLHPRRHLVNRRPRRGRIFKKIYRPGDNIACIYIRYIFVFVYRNYIFSVNPKLKVEVLLIYADTTAFKRHFRPNFLSNFCEFTASRSKDNQKLVV